MKIIKCMLVGKRIEKMKFYMFWLNLLLLVLVGFCCGVFVLFVGKDGWVVGFFVISWMKG